MGGGGSIAGMIISLRNNSKLLRKHSMFKKESSFLSFGEEHLKTTKGKINTKKATSNELKKIREVILKNKRTNIRNFIIVFIVVIPIIFLFVKFTTESVESGKFNPYAMQTDNWEAKEIKKRKSYLFYITDGDKYIKEKHWKNAIFQYNKALNLFPSQNEAKYRLALAYSYSCTNDNLNCKKGLQLTTTFLKDYPENSDFKNLHILFSEIMSSKQTVPSP